MSISIDATVTGTAELDRFLEEFGSRAASEAASLMYERGNAIMTESKQNFVPVDQGTLQGTGVVEPPVVDGGTVSVRLAFGGPAAPYAQRQHEELSYHHPKQGEAKYLETPFLSGIRDLGDWIASGLKSRLGM